MMTPKTPIIQGLRRVWADLWKHAVPQAVNKMRNFGLTIETWLMATKKATYATAVVRILFGLTGLGLIITNLSTLYYTYGSGSAWSEQNRYPDYPLTTVPGFNLFRQVAYNNTSAALYIALLIFLGVLFTFGYRTKIISILCLVMHVGVVESQALGHDQGDSMWRIAMIILWFTDSAGVWSLDSRRRRQALHRNPHMSLPTAVWSGRRVVPWWFRNLTHNLALIALGAQISFVYVSGALYKAGGAPWSGGYAIYDPLQVRQYNTWPEISGPLMAWGPIPAIITYCTIIAQLSFPFMLIRPLTRRVSLLVMMSFHIGIALLMGLPWFSMTMVAVDTIFITDKSWQKVRQYVRHTFQPDTQPQGPIFGPPLAPGLAPPASVLTSDSDQPPLSEGAGFQMPSHRALRTGLPINSPEPQWRPQAEQELSPSSITGGR